MSLHDDFDKEEDLAKSFEAEKSVEKPSILGTIGSNIADSAKSVLPYITDAGDLASDVLNGGIDTARAVGQGLTMGAGDEIGGALSALAERPASYLLDKINGVPSDLAGLPDSSSILDRYRQSQQAIQKENEFSQERSPWLYAGGQIAGGITSGSAIGGALGIGGEAAGNAPKLLDIARNEGKLKALGELGLRGLKTYKQALPVVLTEGALSSKEGGLTSLPEAEKLGKDVLGSALYSLPVTMGLQAVSDIAAPLAGEAASKLKGKVQSTIEESPLLRQMRVAYGYGKQGINPKSQSATLNTELAGGTKLSGLDNERTVNLVNEIQDADSRLGQAVGKTLTDADASFINKGKYIDIDQDTRQALQQVKDIADKYPEIAQNPKVKQIYEKISSANPDVLPSEAKDLIDYMNAYINKFKAATNKTPGEEGILGNLFTTEKKFRESLKSQVPEYAEAAERFQNFRNLVPETIIAGTRPVDVTNQAFGKATDQELFDPLKKLIQGSTRQGTSAAPTQQAFYNTMQGMKTFEQQEAERIASGAIKSGEEAFKRPVSAIEEEIKKHSDDAVARGAMDALDPHTGVGNVMKQIATGTGDTGRSIALSSANLAGRLRQPSTTQNPVAKLSRNIYNAPNDFVTSLANKLSNVKGLDKYGQNLSHALQSTDQNRRNQVLFTIMQNPTARALVDEHTNEEPQE